VLTNAAQSPCILLPKASYVAGWLAGCWHLWSLLVVAYYYVVHLAEFSKGGVHFFSKHPAACIHPLKTLTTPLSCVIKLLFLAFWVISWGL